MKTSVLKKPEKIFGIGPKGAFISLILFVFFVFTNSFFTTQIVVDYVGLIKTIGVILIVSGLGLHFWSFYTLRNWWVGDKLCTFGPFKYFRHPMYAAWITLFCPGLALYLNSWLYFFWIILLHLLWHNLVKKEEKTMVDFFGDEYRKYAKRTGRFFPRMLN